MSVWKNKFIKPSKWARPEMKLIGVKKLIIHYTANNGASARGHFNYFNTLSGTYASAHIFVDRIETLCIVPLDEVCYQANDGGRCFIPELRGTAHGYNGNANLNAVGVEMCLESNGTFHPNMIEKTEDVFVELCKKFNLDPWEDIVRHYDVTSKNCPAPWVKEPQHFIDFKKRVKAKLEGKDVEDIKVDTTPVLQNGDKGAYVKKLQESLHRLGYDLGEYGIDSNFGDSTEKAVRSFQKDQKILIDGIVGNETWRYLAKPKKEEEKSSSVDETPLLQNGDKGKDVKNLQERLIKLGYSVGKYRADGDFGDDTKEAVKQFQKDQKIKSDGVVGQITWGRLDNPKKVKQNKPNLEVDGKWGKATTIALQKYLGTLADGIISGQIKSPVTQRIYNVDYGKGGSTVIKALQKKIGAKEDGYIGSVTIRQLQKHLGTYVDGAISDPSNMVKELQRRLNEGNL